MMTAILASAADPTAPPVAAREPRDVTVHGDKRIDDYFWLRRKDDPRTLAYLEAENAWADAWFAPHAELKEALYHEMLGRIQQDDDSVPYRKGGRWYATKTVKGDQYVAKLRTMKRDRTPLLFKVNPSVGPGGASGRFNAMREVAEDDAFLLAEFGPAGRTR